MRLLFSLSLFLIGLFVAVSAAWADIWTGRPDMADRPALNMPSGNYQVRVQQRIIVRIPARPVRPGTLNFDARLREPPKLREQKIGKCLKMDRLIGSRPGPKESLELITADGALIRAYLGDGCLAREFYAGAYIEKPDDGRLCVARDVIHARTGAKCPIDKFRLLVAE